MSLISIQSSAGAPDEGLEALLARVDAENPDLTDAHLAREFQQLLGRAPEAAPAKRPRKKAAKRGDANGTFEWFLPIAEASPPLTPERTREAAVAVEAGLLAEERLDEMNGAPMTRRDAADLRYLVERGRAEYHLLVVSNLRLVFHWSKGVASSIDPDWAQDAFQAGCIGLMRGVQGWDYSKGFTLSTFVSWHIRQAIQRWRANEVLLIRLPVHVWDRLESEADLPRTTRAAAVRAQNVACIDLVNPESPEAQWDGGLEEALQRQEFRVSVDRAIQTLSDRERKIIQFRFGLDPLNPGGDPLTLEAIGGMLGVTRERVRQLEKKAMEKLRERLHVVITEGA